MIHLVFIACLASAPTTCSERTLSYIEPMDTRTCAMRAQPELARWAARHPEHVITRWRCETDRGRNFPT